MGRPVPYDGAVGTLRPTATQIARTMASTLYTTKAFKVGNAVGMYLDREVREQLRIMPGDLIMLRLTPPYVVIRRAEPERDIPMSDISRGMLPPAWPGRDTDEPSSRSKARTTKGTQEPDSR